MFDKVSLWVNRAMLGDDFADLAARLNGGHQTIDNDGAVDGCNGSLENLRVTAKPTGLLVDGSLPKFLYGDNINTLNRGATKEALEKIGDCLGVDVMDAKVFGFEFGTNFYMEKPIAEYLNRLGDMPRMQRVAREGALYFESRAKAKPKAFVFYDKIAEASAKGGTIPDGLENANLLRYEMRLRGRLAAQLKVERVEAATLFDRDFYQLLVNIYGNSYNKISKAMTKRDDLQSIKTVTSAFEVLVARLMAANQEEARAFVNEVKAAKVFADPKYYTRLVKKIESISTKAGAVVEDALMSELDDEFANVGNMYS